MKTILHIGNIKSGIDTYVRGVSSFASDKFDFIIVGGADDNANVYTRKGKEIPTYKISLYRSLNPVKDLRALFQAVKIIRHKKPSIIHCHSAKGGMIGRIAGLVTGVKTYYTPHAFSFLSSNSAVKRNLFLFLERMTRFNSYVLACSNSEKELAINVVHYKKERVFVWSNAIPDIDKNGVEEVDVFDKNTPFIISVGRPSYQKNPLFMVNVMRRVHERNKQLKLLLVGVGFHSPLLNEMNDLIKEYRLEETIKLLPWSTHSQTLGFVNKSIMYLSTSLYEGLPIAVLEAMALRKTIIASNVIGNKDCVVDGYNGCLLPMDEKVFSERICLMCENVEELKKMGVNSYVHFKKNFDLENRICELEKIYMLE